MTHDRLFKLFLTGSVVSMLIPFALLGADVEIKDLPKPVTETIKTRYPNSELNDARKIVEDGKDVYEVDLTDGGKEIEIAVFPNGKIDWVAVDLEISELPKRVAGAVKKKYPMAKMNHASTVYTVNNGKDHLEHYFVEITQKNGKKRDLDILPNGEIEEDVEAKE